MQKEFCKVCEFCCCEQEIFDIVFKLFFEQGEDSVMVEMIVDVVGIGKGMIYKYFKFKVEIYLCLMLDYECDFVVLFYFEDVVCDKEVLLCVYFEFCMCDLQCYCLFDCLEEKVVKISQVLEMVEELYKICVFNFECLI